MALNKTPAIDRKVVSTYHDCREDASALKKGDKIILPFPICLHALLEDAEANGNGSVASFILGGKAFTIRNRKAFEMNLMPRYFRSTRFDSFQRQLRLYGFKYIKKEVGKTGYYYHELFVRGNQSLSLNIARKMQGASRHDRLPSNRSPEGMMSHLIGTSTCSGPKETSPLIAANESSVKKSQLCQRLLLNASTKGFAPAKKLHQSPVYPGYRSSSILITSPALTTNRMLLLDQLSIPQRLVDNPGEALTPPAMSSSYEIQKKP